MASAKYEFSLLFGIIALQNNFISCDDLVSATSLWLHKKEVSLTQILRNEGKLTSTDIALVNSLVERHIGENLDLGDSDDEAPGVESESKLGTRLDINRFQKIKSHAKGGLGHVFLALDKELGREVAIKEIRPDVLREDSVKRFLAEAKITGRLEHPGIVPVYGLGNYADGRPYYAMKFVRGSTLRSAIDEFHASRDDTSEQQWRLGLRRLLGQFLSACNAIEYAHRHGVIHRDIKPANIMLGKYGETLVVDWGIALVKSAWENGGDPDVSIISLTPNEIPSPPESDTPLGTIAYASPEQTEQSSSLDATTDVYSLGATLYTILTGKAPFSTKEVGKSASLQEVLRRVQNGDFSPPRDLDPSIPPPLESICLKAMSQHSGDRYPTVSSLANALEEWLADEPVSQLMATVEYFEKEFEQFNDKSEYSLRLCRELGNLALALGAMGRHEESLMHARRAKQILKSIATHDANRRMRIEQELFFIRAQEIRSLNALGRDEEAKAISLENEVELARLYEQSRTDPQHMEEFLCMSMHLGFTEEELKHRFPHAQESDAWTQHGTMHCEADEESGTVTRQPGPAWFEGDTCDATPLEDGLQREFFEDHGERYRVIRLIGQGGAARVFEGYDQALNRKIALKVARDALAARILESEAKLMAQFYHPGIPAIFDVGRTKDNLPFFSMPLFEQRLSERLFTEATSTDWFISLGENLTYLCQTCETLEQAHTMGIIHCDPKPSNILIRDGRAALTDWGLACLRKDAPAQMGLAWTPLDRTNGIVGTPVFMAPEQWLGQNDEIDESTDTYILGGVLYAMLSGQPPRSIQKKSIQELMKEVTGCVEPLPISVSNPMAPEALEQLAFRALRGDKSERLRFPRDLRLGIENWLSSTENA